MVSPNHCAVSASEMFLPLLLPFCFLAAEGLPFLTISTLKECPNIPPQENLQIEQIAGSWRLACLFYDDHEDFEGDDTCAVVEFLPINNGEMKIAAYMDTKGDEFVLDRSSLDLSASFQSPGEWMLHSALSDTSYLHVTVIYLTRHHMILTFCITNETVINDHKAKEHGYNSILQELKSDGRVKYFRKKVDKTELKDSVNSDLTALFGRKRYFRRKRSIMDVEKNGENSRHQFFHDKARDGLTWNRMKSEGKNDKHFWTAILVKDNKNSPLSFVENASLLMKFGYDLREGNLASFGKCNI